MANVFPEFLLEKFFLTFQRDSELFNITVDIFKILPQNLGKNFWWNTDINFDLFIDNSGYGCKWAKWK